MTASKWKPYPEYREIPHAGTDKIPNHWDSKRMRYVFRERGEVSEDGTEELLSVSKYTGVKVRSTTTDREARAASLVGYKKCEPNDIVSNIMLAWDSALGVAFDSGIVSSAYEVYVPQREIDPHFLDLLLRTPEYRVAFTIVSKGIVPSRWRMYTESFNDILMILPPLNEQKQIGNFVHRINENISRNIENLETQKSLLEEKRSALITQAVTKGLNPDVPMKDSGIDWIGQIPEHWTVKRVKHIFKTHNGATPKSGNQNFWNGELNWVTPDDLGSIKGIEIGETSRKITPAGYDSCGTSTAKAGSIAISTRAPIGHLAITTSDMSCNQGCRLLEPINNTEIRYFHAFLKASVKELQSWGQGSTFKELPRHRLENLPVLLPPPKEQQEIANYTRDFDDLQIELETALDKQIKLLIEYRKALISAAVTGKIDLRGL